MVARAIMTQAFWEKFSFAGILLLGILFWIPNWVDNYQTQKKLQEDLAAIDPSRFITIDSVFVNDALVGTDPIMLIDSEVLLEFPGKYTVIIKDALTSEAICTADDKLTYKPRSAKLNPKPLSWWADDGECSGIDLPVGAYYIDTTWWIYHGVVGYEPSTVNFVSNVFNMIPDDLQQKIEQLEQEVQELRVLD